MAGILSVSGSICSQLSSSSFTPNLLPLRNRPIQTLHMRTNCIIAGLKQQQQQQQQDDDNFKIVVVNHADMASPEISLLSIEGEHINNINTVSYGELFPVASCHGLFLTTMGGRPQKLAIWNPTSKDDDEVLKTIPQSSVPRPPTLDYETNLMFGFGFDPSSNDYKVMKFVDFECNDGMYCYGYCNWVVELYSLKTQSWKQIEYPHGTAAFPTEYSCVHINGICYCPMSSREDGHLVIIPFDLANENFLSLIRGPNTFLSSFVVVEFEGSLGVLSFNLEQPFEFEIWVWNKKSESWSKRGKWAIGESDFLPVGRFLKNDQIFLQNSMRELVLFDCAKQKLKNLGFYAAEGYFLNVFPYVESSAAEEIK